MSTEIIHFSIFKESVLIIREKATMSQTIMVLMKRKHLKWIPMTRKVNKTHFIVT